MFSHGGKAEIPSSVGSKRAKKEDGRVVEGELKLGWEDAGRGRGGRVPPWNTLTAGRRGI